MRGLAAWLLGATVLLAPGVALADPITIVATLAPYIGGTLAAAAATAAVFISTYGGYILAAYSVYGGIQARRKAKRQAAAARRAYNDSLTDRTVTTLQAAPPQRVVYGRAIVGGDIVAILTSDKTGLRDDGSTYTKPDALKHLVIVLAAHECEAVHEVYIDGIAVGALDGSGWATGGEFGGLTRTIYQERQLAAGASATFDAAPTVLGAGYMGIGDGGWVDTSYTISGNQVTNTSGQTATISVKYTVSQGVVRWEKHLGTADQAASAYLQGVVPDEWTANDRLRGMTYVVVTLDLEEPRFQGGPPPLTFDVSGRVFYDARRNLFGNAAMAGAVAGEPGTVPTDWFITTSSAGVDRQIVEVGVEDGVPYIDVRVHGTPSGAGQILVRTGDTSDDMPASEGQQVVAAGYITLHAGTLSGISQVRMQVIVRDAGGTVLTSPNTNVTPVAGSLKSSRWLSPAATCPATTAWVNANVGSIYFDGSGPVDVTLRIGLPCVFLSGLDPVAAHENPALIIRDWLTAEWGFGVDEADLDEASITAAANACDEQIDLLTVGHLDVPGYRYTCNGAVTTEAAPEAVLEEMAQSMAGLVTHTGGLWVVNAGTYTAPVLALTEDLQAGAIEVVQAGTAYGDLFNGVRGRMIERGRAVESDFDPYINDSYALEDGEELWTDITLPWTDSRYRARNLARIFTEQARESLVIRYPAQLHAWPLQVGDRVTVTSAEYGWSAKVFRVTDWQWSDQSAVLLTLQEDGAAIYDLADAATADDLPNTGLPNPYTVPAITGAAAASGSAQLLVQGDGSVVPRVRVTWDAVASAYVTQGGRIELRWRRLGVDAEGQWRSLDATGDSTGEYLLGAGVGDKVVVALRAVNSLGARGDEVLIEHTVAGDTTAPANATGLAYANVVGGMRVSWSKPGEADYLSTEVRQGASWAAGALLWIGNASNFVWTPAIDAAYNLWVVHRDRSGNESTPVLLATTYSAVGASSGGNSATVRLYKREDLGVAPAIPAVTLTYTFASGEITAGDAAGWSIDPPASSDGRYEWVIQAQAYSNSGTDDTIAPGEWTAPQIHTRDGIDGEGVYLNDGGFETGSGATPWTLGASASLVATSPHQGAQCLRVADATGAAELDAAANKVFLVVPGQALLLSVWSKRGASAPTGQCYVGLRWRSAAGTDLTGPVDYMTIGTTPTWENTTAPFVPPSAAVSAQLVVLTRFQTSGEYFVDTCVIQASAADGAPGEDARSLRLTANAQVFSVDTAGTGSPSSITVTAVQSNLAGSPAFSVVSGSATLTGSGNSRSLSFGNLATDQATIRVTWDGLTDDVTVSKVYAGSSGITHVLSNAAHGLPADDNGAVLSYAGSGTTIQVYEGSTALQFNATLAAGRFTLGAPVVSPPGALTVGARSGSGTNACTVADHTGVSAGGPSAIRVDYPVVLWRANGSAVSFFVSQTITVVRRGAQGDPGNDGADGADGPPGQRGSVVASRQIAGAVWSDAEANTAISSAGYGSPQTLDLVTLYNATGTYSETRVYSAGSWITYAARVDGNLLVLGSITTDKLVANAVTAAQAADTGETVDYITTASPIWTSPVRGVVTLSTTGAPVKGLGHVVVSIDVDLFPPAGAYAQVEITVTSSAGAAVLQESGATVPLVGLSQGTVCLPLVWRHTPAAASIEYRYQVRATLRNASGASFSGEGSITSRAFMVVEENKV